MGNQPSECHGCNCCVCGTRLPPCTSFDNFRKDWVEGYYVYIYNGGQYYREVGVDNQYKCPDCFHRPIRERLEREEREKKKREEEERRKREEEERRRREEAERQRREEEERRRKAEEEQRRRQQEEERQRKEAAERERKAEEERRKREEEERRKLAEEERKKKEDADRKRREEEARQKREAEEREKRELQERLDQTLKNAKAKSEQEEDIVREKMEQKTTTDIVVSQFDEFETIKVHLENRETDNENLMDVLCAKSGISLSNMTLTALTTKQVESLSKSLETLLFQEWPSNPPSRLVLVHTQVLLTELVLTNLKMEDSSLQEGVTNQAQYLVETMNNAGENITEMFNFTQALLKVHKRMLESTYQCSIVKITKQITKTENLPAEEVFLLKFLEILQKCLREVSEPKYGKEITNVEKKCYEVLLNATTRSYNEEAYSELTCRLLRIVQSGLWQPNEAMDFMYDLVKSCSDPVLLTKVLHLIEIYRVPPNWQDEDGKKITDHLGTEILYQEFEKDLKKEPEKSLDAVLEEIKKTGSIDIQTLDKVTCIVSGVQKRIAALKVNERDILENIPKGSLSAGKIAEDLEKILFTLCKGVFKVNNYYPRVTQMVTWCLLALSKYSKLLEVGTGEGKSCIIAMFAAMRVLMGQQVDVVSSSSVLCERDAEDWSPFYKLFSITVDTNTNKTKDEERAICYKADIVYGTVETFAADYLRQTFELKQVRPNRKFHCIIVDEVDSLLLDRGVQLTYLSSDMISLQHLNTILAMIWSVVNQHGLVATENKVFIRGPPVPFYKGIFDCLSGDNLGLEEPIDILEIAEENGLVPSGFSKEIGASDKDKLNEKLKSIPQNAMLKFFNVLEDYIPYHFSTYIQDANGILQLTADDSTPGLPFFVLDNGLCCLLCDSDEQLWEPVRSYVLEHLQFTPCTNNAEKHSIPGFLKNLVETKMQTWVENAFLAIKLQPDREYVVKGDCILPVDFKSTGIIELNKKWGDGLQQFLEMKHQTKISTMSTITNFISNVSYFNKYQGQVFGTTGTLGTDADIQFLSKLYPNLTACRIPTFNRRKLFEVQGEMTNTSEDWKRKICATVQEQISPSSTGKGRAALVICESINRAIEIEKELKPFVRGQLKLYIRSDNDNAKILDAELAPGDVIVATNLAGRGTDIKVSGDVNNSGGLFVVLTFLSQNARVELQAFGRTARKGKPGSAQLIVCTNHMPEYLGEVNTLGAVKRIRDQVAKSRVLHYLDDDIPEIFLREELFFQYCKILLSVYNEIEDVEDEKATVAVLNEYWGIWLQLKSKPILELKRDELLASLASDIAKAKQLCKTEESPCSSIYQYIRFGNKELFDGKFELSSRLFEKSMALDPSWASIAFYSHAYCTIKLSKDNYLNKAMEDLEKAKESLANFKEQCVVTLQLVKLASKSKESEETTRFQNHIMTRCQVLDFFNKNIEEAIKKLKEIKDKGRDAIVEETSVFALVPDAQSEVHQELYEFYKLGLVNIYTVKEKPRFCWEGLVVFLLGVLQLVAGIILTAVTCGTLANIGMALISEGISDCISGAEAMITGEFSWASWAIEKAISVGLSLVSFGIGKVIAKGAKATMTAIKAIGKNLKALPKVLSKQVKTGLKQALKDNIKNVLKYAGKEIAVEILSKTEDIILDKIVEEIKNKAKEAAVESVQKNMKQEPLKPLADTVVLSHLKDGMQVNVLLSDTNSKEKVKNIFKEVADTVLESDKEGLEWQEKLHSSMLKVLGNASEESKGKLKIALGIIQATYMTALAADAIASVITMSNQFNGKYCKDLEKMIQENNMAGKAQKIVLTTNESILLDGFKGELAVEVAGSLVDVLTLVFQQKFSNHLVKFAQNKVNGKINKYLEDKIKVDADTFIKSKEVSTGNVVDYKTDLTPTAVKMQKAVKAYAADIQTTKRPATVVDIRVLAEVTGKRIVVLADNKGDMRKIQALNPKTKTITGTISVIYRPKSEQYPSGRYDVCIKGKVVTAPGEGKVYTAVAKGLEPDVSESKVTEKATELKALSSKTLMENASQWSLVIQRKKWVDDFRGVSIKP
ncbi:uncharacterized protein LOC114657229 isoform X3 [Erpetoichthys calabaricus]|uniref:uncharacterized protein LOC114657229 isoform X3 n=1 Tax=Erpetoichthys calabaricus TaxID=27687 RepID=UPI002234293B|nr:uncharacterized protein LOC114657229 isoform X3 [Erpetoichthys calabaricus]